MYKLHISYTQLTKAVLLLALVHLFSITANAQSDDDLLVITMQNKNQYVGKVISENYSTISFDIEGVEDDILLEKAFVKHRRSAKGIIFYRNGKYHKTEGVSTTIGLANFEAELMAYKHVKSDFAVGGGIGMRLSLGNGFRWDHHFKYADIVTYGKYYLNNNKQRFYVEAKLGYAFPLGDKEYNTKLDGVAYEYNYVSGVIFQPGFGWQFACSGPRHWGIKLKWNRQNNFISKVSTKFLGETASRFSRTPKEHISSPIVAINLYW